MICRLNVSYNYLKTHLANAHTYSFSFCHRRVSRETPQYSTLCVPRGFALLLPRKERQISCIRSIRTVVVLFPVKPLVVMPSPTVEDVAVVAAVWRHRHESRVPHCRGAAGHGVRTRKPLERGAWRHQHERHVPRYRGAAAVWSV